MKLQKRNAIILLNCIIGLSDSILTFTNLPANSSIFAEVEKPVSGVSEAKNGCANKDAILAPLSNRVLKIALLDQFQRNQGKQACMKTAF